MLARVHSAATLGLEARVLDVEVDVARGLPRFTIVGLPDATVREARERVRSALRNSGFAVPEGAVTVNLAPADFRKCGAALDLPVAMGLVWLGGVRPTDDRRPDLRRRARPGRRGPTRARGPVPRARRARRGIRARSCFRRPTPPRRRPSTACGSSRSITSATPSRTSSASRPIEPASSTAPPGSISRRWTSARSEDRRWRAARSRSPPPAAIIFC